MLEILFDSGDNNRIETESTDKFYEKYAGTDENMGDDFYTAIRDTRFAGYREGVADALKLFAECGIKT